MLKNWFDASEAEEVGRGFAVKFSQSYPMLDPKKEMASGNKGSLRAKIAGGREKALDRLRTDVMQYAKTHRLNVYKKAKLGNAFKWQLRELGYEADFIDQLTREVVLALK